MYLCFASPCACTDMTPINKGHKIVGYVKCMSKLTATQTKILYS